MFFKNKKTAGLEGQADSYRKALDHVAKHVGLHGLTLDDPAQLAAAICRQIDGKPASTDKATSKPGSEVRPVPAEVRKITLNGSVSVVVRQGSQPKMEVFADNAGDLHKIKTSTTLANSHLVIDNEAELISQGGDMTQIVRGSRNIQVAGRSISNLKVGGSITINESTHSPRYRVELTLPHLVSLKVNGAGDLVYQDIDQSELTIDVQGAGSVSVCGAVELLDAEVSGAGGLTAYELIAQRGRLRASGAGSMEATVTKSVAAHASGASKIKISGNPPERDTDVSGVGKIKFAA